MRHLVVPEIADLMLLLDAAERENLGSVARLRHVSQSTVSRAIQRVETALGRPVFDRVGKSVRLRGDAVNAVEGIRSIVREWSGLVEQPSAELLGLSLFCTVTASQAVLPALLASFRRSYAGIQLELQTGPASDAIAAVTLGHVDVAVAALPVKLPAGLVMQRVTTSPLIAVAAPDVRDWSTLVLPRSGITRSLVDVWRQQCRRSLPKDVAIQQTDSHEEVVALAALGSGIGIVPKLVVDTSALRSQLRELTPPQKLPTMELGLVARRRDVEREPLASLWSMAGE